MRNHHPGHFVRHVEANDLDLDRSLELIAKSITDIAITLRSEKHVAVFTKRPPSNQSKIGKRTFG